MYPKNGQSQEQQSTDKRECQQWAGQQAGQDGANGSDYQRAMVACVEGRGLQRELGGWLLSKSRRGLLPPERGDVLTSKRQSVKTSKRQSVKASKRQSVTPKN